MAQTRAAFIKAVLDELGVSGAGQTIAAEDSAAVDGRIAPKLADLEAREIFPPVDADAIEDAAFPWLVEVMAHDCAAIFGMDKEIWAAKAERAEFKLRVLVSPRPTLLLRQERFWR